MKTYKLLIITSLLLLGISSCKDDEMGAGNPAISQQTVPVAANFGDSISFAATVSDNIPLSTLKAQLFYGDIMVSEEVIRTKTNGDYAGKLFVPFLKDIPNGNATLKLVLQNISFAIAQKDFDLPLTRPDYETLDLVLENGTIINMNKTSQNNYAATQTFPKEVLAHIVAPKMGTNGNKITFGWLNGAIAQGNTNNISFKNALDGSYSITFNTLTYTGAPFFKFLFNGAAMDEMDSESYSSLGSFTKNQVIPVSGIVLNEWNLGEIFTKKSDTELVFNLIDGKYKIIANFITKTFSSIEIKDITIDFTETTVFTGELVADQAITFNGIGNDWWMDPDFFTAGENNQYLFSALSGKYKITANATLKYLVVEAMAMTGNNLATLQEDGSGAIWIIGSANIGKPSYAANGVGWNTDKGLCMAPIGNKKYKISLVAGESLSATEINIKFFLQKGWGGEFSADMLSSTSDVVYVNSGSSDNGNVFLTEGKTLTAGKTYEFVVDVSAGNNKAILTVTPK